MLSDRMVPETPTKVWRSRVIYMCSANTIVSLRATTTPATAMAYNPPNSSSSIFHDGNLRPGIYKIQNIVSKTYVDIKDHIRELCGRPSTTLESFRGEVSSRFR